MLLPPLFAVALAGYAVLATIYSFYLKRLIVADVIALAGFYTLRILAGGTASAVPISSWLLTFSMFLFLSLAFVKRYSELRMLRARDETSSNGRGYETRDLELLRSVGPTSGYIAVLVLGLYINSADVTALYHTPAVLWFLAPALLYWITRMWFLADRGMLDADPVVFTVRDPVSYAISVFVGLILIIATL
jgi:4-hydroxybenzoate polyprenyltransferase